jgi:hypothetical protein
VETHAWIGWFIAEWEPNTEQEIQVDSRQKIDLWFYTHDSDLAGS